MKLTVEGSKKIDDGMHEGVITRLQERKDPYHYIDLVIECDGCELKAGYPATLQEKSNLGKLLNRFGIVLEIGKEMDLKEILIGKRVRFQTISEQKGDLTFSKIITESVKLA